MKRRKFDEGGESLPVKFEIVDAPATVQAQMRPAGRGYFPEADEDEDEGGLLEYWRVIKRRKGTLIVGAVAGLVLGVVVTLPQTPVYQARTTLEVLEMNQNFMNMQNVQQVSESTGWNMAMDIQTQIKILQSDALLERVEAGLSEGAGVKKEAEEAETGRVSAWRRALNLPEEKKATQDEMALAMAADTVKARASGQTRIVEVTVDSTDAQVAAKFANRLTQEFIEQNVEARYKMTQKTGDFLAKQLDDMRARLERSEDALNDYARRTGLVFTGGEEKGGKTNVSEEKLSQVQQELTRAQSELVTKQSRWEMASNAPAETLPDVLNDGSLREYQTKIAELRRQEAELGETYSDDNSRVKKVKAQIKSMEGSLLRQRGDILRRIKNEYEEAERRVKLLDMDYRRQTGVVTEQGGKAVQYNILKREAETNRQMYEGMLQRMKEASIASAMRASNIRVVDPAKTPKAPYKPRMTMNAALGLIGGGFFALAFVLMTEKADRTLQDPSDVAFYLNLPELGTIPSESMGQRKRLGDGLKRRLELPGPEEGEEAKQMELVVHQRKPSLHAESFRATLTSVLFAQQASGARRVLVVTSANPAEGKTTVASNLAIAMAETGRKVLLIDADTKRPRLHDVFVLPNQAGLSTLLMEVNRPAEQRKDAKASLEGLVFATQVENLTVMPVGPSVSGLTNLLYAKGLPALLAQLEEEFDEIVIDTPPVLQIPDARLLGRMSGGVILVVRAGRTTRDAAVAARLRLKEDGIPVMGTVMNDWNPKMSKGGYYGNYDGYSRYYRRYYGHKIHEG